MLAVLSESNCLQSLNNLGVYPDRFYTDFDAFRNESTTFVGATVIIIFAGSNHFNKRLVINVAKSLMKRAENQGDVGITHVYVFSDIAISGLYAYYKYRDRLDVVDVMRGWSAVRKDVSPWAKLRSEKKESVVRLSKYDMGDAEAQREAYKNLYSSEDEYRKLIVVPDIREQLKTS